MQCARGKKAAAVAVAAAVALLLPVRVRAQQGPESPSVSGAAQPTVAEIVDRLEQSNRERTEALKEFEGERVYRMEYHGFFGTHGAEMAVRLEYKSPDEKEFTIVSQSGSKFMIDHVMKGLLDGEKEAATAENQKRTTLNSDNYAFQLAGVETTAGEKQYILEVSPKTDYKYLYRGKIWVDAKDFAVTHIEVEPARTPSFWVKKSEIRHQYEKIGDFWLPEENQTQSSIRLGGQALLTIEYKDYKITKATPVAQQESPRDVAAASAAVFAIRSN